MAFAKTAAALLMSEKGRAILSFILIAVLSPAIMLTAFLCASGTAGAEHNQAVVKACFYGAGAYPEIRRVRLGEGFFRQLRRSDAGILCVFQGGATTAGGKRPGQTCMNNFGIGSKLQR